MRCSGQARTERRQCHQVACNGDDSAEIVYIDDSTATLRCIDDVGGSPTVETLREDRGSTVPADKDTGVVS